MMNRTELREQVFKLLFRVEFNSKEDMAEQEELFTETSDHEFSKADADYVRDKYEKIAEKLPEIDEAINKETSGWDTGRMAKVELTIIRLAIYEIKYDDGQLREMLFDLLQSFHAVGCIDDFVVVLKDHA